MVRTMLRVVFVLLMTIEVVLALVKLPPNETVPAVIVFGDSIVDAGNNNQLRTLVKCNFAPYGIRFKGGTPTGRFCDGKIPSDLIAAELGIKDIVPAYLDPNLKKEDLATGVTFASGGTGYDPLTSKIVSVLSLTDQLELFKQYIGNLTAFVGEKKANTILGQTLYLVVAGSDDIANTYFTARFRKFQYDVSGYAGLMVESASSFLKELYALGARRIAVFSAPPIGCVPAQRTLAGGTIRGCAEDYNDAARTFNAMLSSKLDSLNKQLPHSKMVYIDVYKPLLDLIMNPMDHGFAYADKGCCGTGNIEVAILCNKLEPYTCTDLSDYLFFDSYHPTEKAYKTLITPLIRKYLNKFF
ncbi:GDSL esterase/lipase EXL3-like [Punica granatum]|uniref:GDSL esterase/lipase EXL3-like n=1 Tax=Punica granatum TaxID=22663 RepID=A0A218WR39_PUNGR|nr:GDSL esterase/lipase EXL3-like [Punica granatum]OWM74969.1 hypothetical protein CDL15_Pgr021320 [Punica granatum]